MKPALALVCFALMVRFSPGAETAGPKANTFHYTNESFAITLPTGWKELPPERILELRKLSAQTSRFPLQGMVHVYQFETAEEPFALPMVIVQVGKTGRVADLFMQRLVCTNDPRGQLTRYLRELGIYDNSVRSLSFDTNRFMLRLDAVKQNDQSRDRALMKIFFTEEGAITVGAIATELDFPKWSATFGQIVDSVNIAEKSRYHLRTIDLSSGARDWLVLALIVGVLSAAGFGWFYFSRVRGPSTLDY